MKKSALSVFSLVCGITASSLGVILLPLAIVAGKSSSGITLLGMLVIFMMTVGFGGTVGSITKLLTTSSSTMEDSSDRSIAVKALWFSVSPCVIWTFFMLIGSTIR